MPPRILIADDDTDLRTTLSELLTDEGYDVNEAESGDAVLTALANGASDRPSLVIMDVRMPGKSGLDVLRELRGSLGSQLPILVMTAYGGSNVAIEAIQLGAYDYITKPFDLEDMLATIKRYFDWQELNDQVIELSTRLTGAEPETFIGNSTAMQEVYKTIGRVARSDATVLISGETGTGKELVATILHRNSGYARGPLVKVNCAALPETLLESELFGHEKGAFTGSVNEKAGAFEMAHGGTIFLDEVAEMATDIQVKLLRAIETRTIRRLGGKKEISVDIRIVAATNRDLQKALAENELREDLYYRLAVVEVFLPPLRDRAGDIKLLANEFLTRFSQQNGKKIKGFDERAWEWILSHNWPGNVRELKNAVERAVIMARGDTITAEDITPRHLRTAGEFAAQMTVPHGATLADTRKQLVLRTFASTNGDAARTGKIIGISAEEVKSEIGALLHSNGAPKAERAQAAPEVSRASRPARPATPKSKTKKR